MLDPHAAGAHLREHAANMELQQRLLGYAATAVPTWDGQQMQLQPAPAAVHGMLYDPATHSPRAHALQVPGRGPSGRHGAAAAPHGRTARGGAGRGFAPAISPLPVMAPYVRPLAPNPRAEAMMQALAELCVPSHPDQR